MDNSGHERAELLRHIALLEAENQLLTDYGEEMLLVRLIAEGVQKEDSDASIFEHLLEQITSLLNLKLGLCLSLHESDLRVEQGYALHEDSKHKINAQLQLRNRDHVNKIWKGMHCSEDTIPLSLTDLRTPSILQGMCWILLPIKVQGEPYRLLLFTVSEKRKEQLLSHQPLLEHIVEIVISRLTNLELFSELNLLNSELEERVSKRSRELEKSNRAQKELHALLDQVVTAMPSVLIGIDKQQKVILWNRLAERETGISKASAMGQPLYRLYPFLFQHLQSFDLPTLPAEPEVRKLHYAEGDEVRYFNLMVYSLELNASPCVMLRLDDLTEYQLQEHRLQRLTYYDSLTGFYNRTAFMEMFRHILLQADRHEGSVGILYFDLDRFKQINDSLGHQLGDKLLVQVAQRLKEAIRNEDMLARLGGDEFAILLEEYHSVDDLARVSKKIMELLHKPFAIEGHQLYLSACIGISHSPNDGNDADLLLKNAEAAMYQAKRSGRDRLHFYTASLTKVAEDHLSLEMELRHALEAGEFVLFYQPKVDIKSGELFGAEALIRWQHPQRGLLAPGQFLSTAQDAGLMPQITKWVISEVCRQLADWQQQALDFGAVSLNIDSETLNRGDLLSTIEQQRHHYNISAERIELEILERGLLAPQIPQQFWQTLVYAGYTLAIDDFGIGESSLARLRQLPVTILKIDRSFVMDIEKDENDRIIIKTIIAMGESLGLSLLAEGVETLEQLNFLQKCGCHLIQGYLFSKPIPPLEFTHFVREWSPKQF